MDPRFSARVTKAWWRIETRASEAKGPFPGGKRVGSWGKKKKRKERERKKRARGEYQRIYIRRPFQYLWVGE